MSRKETFERLLESGSIGSVKTRKRIIKTGPGLLMWPEEDVHMREEVKAFYESVARGGVGLSLAPMVRNPLLETFLVTLMNLIVDFFGKGDPDNMEYSIKNLKDHRRIKNAARSTT